jgi:hypothetical protein
MEGKRIFEAQEFKQNILTRISILLKFLLKFWLSASAKQSVK